MNKIEIRSLEQRCIHTKDGIPEDIFLFFSRHIPMVNIDLLINDEQNRTLLSWRDDECGTGWHVPGGMVLLNEMLLDCIDRISMKEIGTLVGHPKTPDHILEMFMPNSNRKHCISIVYRCFLSKKYNLPNVQKNTSGYLKWHKGCPDNLIQVHEQYRNLIIR